jgi:hypothetical protein
MAVADNYARLGLASHERKIAPSSFLSVRVRRMLIRRQKAVDSALDKGERLASGGHYVAFPISVALECRTLLV